MSLYDNLLENFGKNQPIFINDIQYNNYSRSWLDKELSKLCKENKLSRFENGIYYIPIETPFGKSILNPQKVMEYKYIKKGEQINGFYTGLSALNQYGLSNQVPSITEICTNNESSKSRNVKIGNQIIRVKRSRVKITNENADILNFLELINELSLKSFDKEKIEILRKIINDKKIKRKQIAQYAPFFPDKVIRNLVESEIIYDATQ